MSFPIVGIGTSAGGLESALLAGIRAKTGMAYGVPKVFKQSKEAGGITFAEEKKSASFGPVRWHTGGKAVKRMLTRTDRLEETGG